MKEYMLKSKIYDNKNTKIGLFANKNKNGLPLLKREDHSNECSL